MLSDILQKLRLQNIFGSQNNPMDFRTPPTFPTNPGSGSDGMIPPDMISTIGGMNPANGSDMGEDDSIESLIARLYHPETGASDRFSELAKSMPERPNNQGALRRISAVALATMADKFGGGGGQQAYSGVMYPGFARKMSDWKEQLDPAYKSATLERGTNTNERQMAYQTAQAVLRDRGLDQAEKRAQAKEELDKKKLELAQLKQSNPNLKFHFGGPTVLVGDPASGKVTDTGVATGSLSAVEKMHLQQEFQRSMQEDRQSFQSGQQEDRQQYKTDNPTESGSGRGALLPTQERTRRANTAEMLMTDDRFKPYIKLNSNGDPEIVGRPSPEMKEFLRKQIFGDIPQFESTNIPTPGKVPFIGGSDMSVAPPAVSRIPSMGPNATPPPALPGTSSGPALPQSKGPNVMSKQVRNKETKQIITVYSRDGGKTWTDK